MKATPSDILNRALEHLEASPGKRLRPRLLIASSRALGGEQAANSAIAAAEAIELVHTYSLIHDDLPAMDNDALRRGRPTLHVAFDEATAILIGDGLQARAFELVAGDTNLSSKQRVALIDCLARAAGFNGMVGGQSLDMQATAKPLDLEGLRRIHGLKTGALITAALVMGGIVAECSDSDLEVLSEVGDRIGLAFQIIDDVLDVRGDTATLGKTPGKDEASSKSTYVSLMGLSEAESSAFTLYREALTLIEDWDENAQELRELLSQMVNRIS